MKNIYRNDIRKYASYLIILLLIAVSGFGQTMPPQVYVKNKQWKNVRDYGAKGDSVTDDWSAIQTLLNVNTGDSGVTIYAPVGIYRLSRPLRVNTENKKRMTIEGGGWGTKFIIADTGGIICTVNTAAAQRNLLLIKDISLICQTGNDSAKYGIKLYGQASFGIENVSVEGAGWMDYGIQLIGSQQGYIKGGLIKDNVCGIALDSSPVPPEGHTVCNQVTINSTNIQGWGTSLAGNTEYTYAVRFGAIDNGGMSWNHLYGCSTIVYVGPHARASIENNHFETGYYGIYIDSATDCVINNNYITYSDRGSMKLERARWPVITNNIFDDSVIINSNCRSVQLFHNYFLDTLIDRANTVGSKTEKGWNSGPDGVPFDDNRWGVSQFRGNSHFHNTTIDSFLYVNTDLGHSDNGVRINSTALNPLLTFSRWTGGGNNYYWYQFTPAESLVFKSSASHTSGSEVYKDAWWVKAGESNIHFVGKGYFDSLLTAKSLFVNTETGHPYNGIGIKDSSNNPLLTLSRWVGTGSNYYWYQFWPSDSIIFRTSGSQPSGSESYVNAFSIKAGENIVNFLGRIRVAGSLFPADSGSNGYQLTSNGAGTLSWAAAAGTGSGTADSTYINDGSTQYGPFVNDMFKIKEGTGINITREDSTTYDVFKIAGTVVGWKWTDSSGAPAGGPKAFWVDSAKYAGKAEVADSAAKALKDALGNTISSTYAPLASPTFTGTISFPSGQTFDGVDVSQLNDTVNNRKAAYKILGDTTYFLSPYLRDSINKPGADVRLLLYNLANANGSSHARFKLGTNGASSGDPYYSATVTGVTDWSFGIDNSVTDDPFIFSRSDAMGMNNKFTINSQGISADSATLGGQLICNDTSISSEGELHDSLNTVNSHIRDTAKIVKVDAAALADSSKKTDTSLITTMITATGKNIDTTGTKIRAALNVVTSHIRDTAKIVKVDASALADSSKKTDTSLITTMITATGKNIDTTGTKIAAALGNRLAKTGGDVDSIKVDTIIVDDKFTIGAKRLTGNQHFRATISSPNAVFTKDAEVCLVVATEAALTITSYVVTCDADPTTEIQYSLKWADAFIGFGNAAVIDDTATVAGVTSVTSGMGDPTIPAGKCIYLLFESTPDAATTQMAIDITYNIDP